MTRLATVRAAGRDAVEQKSAKWPILAILIFASLVRIFGAAYCLPYPLSPEERRLVKQAYSFTVETRKPREYDKPVITSYIYAGEYGAFYGLGRVFGRFGYVHEYAAYFFKRPGVFYVLARLTSAFFGVLSIYVIYMLCRRLFEWGIGIMAAFIIAVEPHHVELSRTGTGETLALLFAVLALYHLANTDEERRLGSTFVSAVFAGLAASVQFPYAALIVAVYLSYIVTIPRAYKPGAWITGLFFLAGCFLFGMLLPCGMLLLSPAVFAKGVLTSLYMNCSTGDLGDAARRLTYLRQLVQKDFFSYALGWAPVAGGLLGIVWGIGRGKFYRWKFVVISITLVVSGVLLFPWDRDSYMRWASLVSVPLSVGAAHLVYRLFWRTWIPAVLGIALLAVGTCGIAAQGAVETAISLMRRSADDTRWQFGEWAKADMPGNARVLTTPDVNFLFRRADLRPGNTWGQWREEALSTWNRKAFDVKVLPVPPLAGEKLTPLEEVDYVVADSWSGQRLNSAGPASLRFLGRLFGGQPRLAGAVQLLLGQGEWAKAALSQIEAARSSGEVVKSFQEPAPGLKGFGPSITVIKTNSPPAPEPPAEPEAEPAPEYSAELGNPEPPSGEPVKSKEPEQPQRPQRPERAGGREDRGQRRR